MGWLFEDSSVVSFLVRSPSLYNHLINFANEVNLLLSFIAHAAAISWRRFFIYIYIYCISWVSELLYIWASICEGARLALISCYQKCVVVFWVPEILDNVSIPSPSILLCWERRLWNCLSMSIIEVSSPDLLTREYVHMIRLQGSLRDEKIISY